MTRTDTRETATTLINAQAEAMLRDMAFVLRMTQRVKGEMRPTPRPTTPAPRTESRVAVAC